LEPIHFDLGRLTKDLEYVAKREFDVFNLRRSSSPGNLITWQVNKTTFSMQGHYSLISPPVVGRLALLFKTYFVYCGRDRVIFHGDNAVEAGVSKKDLRNIKPPLSQKVSLPKSQRHSEKGVP